MSIIRRIACYILLGLVLVSFGCARKSNEDNPQLKSSSIESKVLKKTMSYKVYLPVDYSENKKYPVLYFLPDYGGSDTIIISQYEIGSRFDALYKTGKIKPMIIVAVRMDRSFGINSSADTSRFTTSSGKSFDKGMYEDYFCNELVPEIDKNYSTIASMEGRYIGGYSMGGFAALHIAFRHPDMFSKAGGHSPSLFVGEFPDKTISDWLYPDEDKRQERDPLYLAGNAELNGLKVYLDTGETDVNAEGCDKLYKLLKKKGVSVEFELFPLIHSRTYCSNYMENYLTFYGGE